MNEIIEAIGDFIFVENKPQKADLIIVVGGSFPQAAETAADLWKSGYAPRVFIGGGVSIKTGRFPGPQSKKDIYNKNYESEYDFYKDVLLHNGVDEAAIWGENRSSFTRENAVFCKQAADERNLTVHKALLVCKNFHARRSLMFFQSAFPRTELLVVPYAAFGITKSNWFQTEYGVKRVLGEVSRCGSQFDFSDLRQFMTGPQTEQ